MPLVAPIVLLVGVVLGAPAAAAAAAPRGRWDPRVERYVRFVERARALDFVTPVRVRFLDDDEFRAAASRWYDDVGDRDRAIAERQAADLLALGLVTAPVDLLAAEWASDAEGITGWYDEEREEMVIRGAELDDVEVRLTIVHELVHALQDQHFDLDALDRRAGTGGERAALGALVEGDASRVELEYLWSLPQDQQDAYWESAAGDLPERALPGGETAPQSSWPAVLELSSALEYELAPVALDVVVAAHGRRAVDALFRAPPRSEEVIIDPAALEARDRPVPVELPAFAPDETPRGRADDWGAYSWYLVLASRLPWSEALAAVDGWGGDRARSYTRTVDGGEQACIRLAVTGDTERDTTELATAIAAWSAAMPPGAVHDTREGELVVVSACATGDAPTPVDDALLAAYDRLWERTDEMWYLVDRHTPPSVRTRCVAAGLVADDVTRPLLARRHELTRAERRTVSDRLDAETRRCA